MGITRRRVALSVAAVGLTGCAATSRPADPAAVASIRSIALVSAFNPKLRLNYQGFTVFTNASAEATEDFGLDDIAVIEAEHLLAGRFTLTKPACNRAKIASMREAGQGSWPEALGTCISAGSVDAVLFMGSTEVFGRPLAAGMPRQRLGGTRVWGLTALQEAARRSSVIVVWAAVLLDGRTFTPLAFAAPQPQTEPMAGVMHLTSGTVTTLPLTMLPFQWQGGAWATMPAEQRASVRDGARSALTRTVPEALAALGLTTTLA